MPLDKRAIDTPVKKFGSWCRAGLAHNSTNLLIQRDRRALVARVDVDVCRWLQRALA